MDEGSYYFSLILAVLITIISFVILVIDIKDAIIKNECYNMPLNKMKENNICNKYTKENSVWQSTFL